MERLQTRRHGADLLAFVFGQLGDAGFALGEPHQKAQPLGVAERLKDRGTGFDLRPRRQANRRARRMPAMHGISVNGGFHYNVPSIHGIIAMSRVRCKAQGLNHDGTNGTEIKIALTLSRTAGEGGPAAQRTVGEGWRHRPKLWLLPPPPPPPPPPRGGGGG